MSSLRDPKVKYLIGLFVLLGTPAGWWTLEALGREEEIHAQPVVALQPSLVNLSLIWRIEAGG
jgi:hypothetical protein